MCFKMDSIFDSPFPAIDNFIDEYSGGYLKPFTRGSYSKVYKYDNKIYIVQPYNEAVEMIYNKLEMLDDKRHILLPTDTNYILEDIDNKKEELVLEFEPCSGDLFLDKMDKGSEVALNNIRDNLPKYDSQFEKMEDLVKSIHKLGIHTMDIKPRNMLFCEDDIIKMTDFGGSKIYHRRKWEGAGAGTQGYVAGNWDGTQLDDYQEDLFALYLSFVEIIEPNPLESKADQYMKGIVRVNKMYNQTTNEFSKKWLQKMKEIVNYKVELKIRNRKNRRKSLRKSMSLGIQKRMPSIKF